MYTGRTTQPCCLCGETETVSRLDLPPRAVAAMKHGGPVAWRDIEGAVSIHFCASDWETVRDLVVETGMSPLPRCNAARAAFDLRDDYEALTNDDRPEPDQAAIERRLLEAAEATLADWRSDDPHCSDRDVVEALVVQSVIDEPGGSGEPSHRELPG
ncbi:MAG: hypothetical protein ABEJ08_01815 [Halobacteriaceae archaeon]